MTFPLDSINEALDRFSAHEFYRHRVPREVSGPDDFFSSVPLMTREDLVREMQKPGYGAFGGTEPVRINLSPTGDGLLPILQSKRDLDRLITAARSHLDACGVEPGDVCAVFFWLSSICCWIVLSKSDGSSRSFLHSPRSGRNIQSCGNLQGQ